MLNFRIDRHIIRDVIYSLKDPRYSVTLAVSADLIRATASSVVVLTPLSWLWLKYIEVEFLELPPLSYGVTSIQHIRYKKISSSLTALSNSQRGHDIV